MSACVREAVLPLGLTLPAAAQDLAGPVSERQTISEQGR